MRCASRPLRRTVLSLGKVIVVVTVALSTALIAVAFSHTPAVSIALLPFIGAGMMLQSAAAHTILQTVVSEDLRGRVMSFYTMTVLGPSPSAAFSPASSPTASAPFAGALCCLAGGIWFAIRRPNSPNTSAPSTSNAASSPGTKARRLR